MEATSFSHTEGGHEHFLPFRMGGGAKVKFYPYKKWGETKVIPMLNSKGGGTNKFFWGVLTWELQVLAILKGHTNIVHPLKGGVGGGGVG